MQRKIRKGETGNMERHTDRIRRAIILFLPFIGLAFLLWYVKNATCDVVYSDYIRLVNSYLPDVTNPKKFLVPDVLTRIPLNYLGRIINVRVLGFSITFDRILGVVSVFLASLVLANYSIKQKIGALWFFLFMAVMFGLSQWEMLTNGSGWTHFFAFACFYYHQLVFDRYQSGNGKKGDVYRLYLLPFLITLGTAGPYCAVYSVVMMLSSIFCLVREKNKAEKKRYGLFFLCVLIPLLLYIVSNSFAVEEHAGATGRSLGTILSENPTFPVRFLLKSLAGMVIGGETLTQFVKDSVLSNTAVYLLGVFVALGYLGAFWLNISAKIYQKTLFPLMLLFAGMGNHALIFLSRYIFEREDYALSSRYALQFQVGILGILLTFALWWKMKGAVKDIQKKGSFQVWQAVTAMFCIAILLGNGYTTYQELKKAPYREENFEKMAQTALEIPFMSDEELKERGKELDALFEYRKGTEKIRDAFRILEQSHLNVFRNEKQ